MNQQENSIVIVTQKLVGYSNSQANFKNVNGLPKYEVGISINGGPIKIHKISFQPHHIVESSAANMPVVKKFLDAIDYKIDDFQQNGVPLPSFGSSTSPEEVRLLSSQFGSIHVGGHNADVTKSLSNLAKQYEILSTNLINSSPEDRPKHEKAYNDFLSNAKSTTNGIATKIRKDLIQPGNGITLMSTDPDHPSNTGSGQPERPFLDLHEQIDASTGKFVEGSDWAEDPTVRQGSLYGSDAPHLQLTQWQDDPEIDIKTAKFTGEREVPKLISGDQLVKRAEQISKIYEDPKYTKTQIDQLGLTPDGGFSLSKIATAAVAIEGLKQAGFVGDILSLADTIAEAHRLVGAGQIEQAEQELARYFGDVAGGFLGGAAGGGAISALITTFFSTTPHMAAGTAILTGVFSGGFLGSAIGGSIAKHMVIELQKSLNGGGPLVLDDIIDLLNKIAITQTGTPVFREFTGTDNLKGYEVPSDAAAKLGALPGNGENSVFDLGEGTFLFVDGGLKPGQSVTIAMPNSSINDPIQNPSRIFKIGVSEEGRKFGISGQDIYSANLEVTKFGPNDLIDASSGDSRLAGVLDLLNKVKLADDFRPFAVEQVLSDLAKIDASGSMGAALLIRETTSKILEASGREHQVLELTDGNHVWLREPLEAGGHVAFVEGASLFLEGNPHYDPVIGAGYDYSGAYFETRASDILWYLQVSAAIDQELGIEAVVEAVNNQQVSFAQEVIVSLRSELEGDEDDDTLSGAEGDEVLDGDSSGDGLQVSRVPGPTIDNRQAVFSDSNGDGVLDAVTRVTYFSDGTQVRKSFKIDAQGEPITEGRVTLHQFDQAIDGAAIGSIFGSQLGNALVGDDLFAQIGAGSVLSSVLGNFGEAIDLYFTDNGVDSLFFEGQRLGTGQELLFGEAIEEAFDDFGADLLSNLRSAGVSTASGFLAAELGEALGLDSGFEGQLFQTVAGKTIGTVANKVLDNISALNDPSAVLASGGTVPSGIFDGLSNGLVQAGAGAVSTFIGGYLAREIVTAESQAGAIGGSLGGAIGSTIGFGLAGVGFLGSAIGSIGAGITAGLGTAFGISLGSVILPGVGAFLGTILGTVLGDVFDDLFGGSGYPKGTANIALDFESGLYYESGTNAANGGGAQLALVTSLAERSETIINSYLDMMGGENANSYSPNVHFYQVGPGSSSQGLHINVIGPDRTALHHTRLQPHEITGEAVDAGVERAVLAAIKTIQVKGGDLYLKRAVLNSQAEDLRAFAGDLKIAEDYRAYLADKAIIDALIAEQPNSAFAAGWLITLLRAEELGLTKWQESDFYGGLEGLLMSLDVEARYGVALEDVVVSVETETLESGAQRRDLVLSTGEDETAELMARIPDFEDAAGFAFLGSEETSGGAGKDIWIASDQGGVFRDTATARDHHSHDVLIGGAGDDTIEGGVGWDFIRGGGGSDTLQGGAHEDTIFGQMGDDILMGDYAKGHAGTGHRAGTDPLSLSGADANDGSTREWFGFWPAVRGPIGHYNSLPERTLFGADKLYGGEGDDILIGVGGSDLLFGGEGDDALFGGEDGARVRINQHRYDGDDYLEGGAGADHISGGEGYDTASYVTSDAAVAINLAELGPQSGGHAEGDVLVGVEDLIGSAFDDDLRGNAESNTLDGGLGNDYLRGGAGTDTVSYYSSEIGVEVDLSSDLHDPSLGFGRKILADGSADAPELDTLVSIEGVIGSDFDDIITGSDQGSGTLVGQAGNDLFQIAFDDLEVLGGEAATTVQGGAGFDTLSFAGRENGVTIDLTQVSSGNRFHSIEHLVGSAGDDVLTADLTGGVIEGGKGNDILYGGQGASVYVFNLGDGSDIIHDMGFREATSREHALVSGSSHDVISFGLGIEFRHILGELSAAEIPDFMPEAFPHRRFETGSAVDFSQAGFQLGVRNLDTLEGAYTTSVAELNDKIEITYGGLLEETRFVDTTFERWCSGGGGEAGQRICSSSTHRETYEVQENAGAVERLQFADSGYLVLADVRHFVTGSADDDVTEATEGRASWIFSGEGEDWISGSAEGDILVGGKGDDRLEGAAGADQYAYWLGDGHDIIEDTGGLDALVFGGGITRSQLKIRIGTLGDADDPESFADATENSLGTDLRIEIIDGDGEGEVAGSVTIRSYALEDSMIERIRIRGDRDVDVSLDALSDEQPLYHNLESAISLEMALSDLLPTSLGTAYDDVLTAKEGELRLNGRMGNDELIGNGANNILSGGAGADVIDGAEGLDWVSYEDAEAGVIVDLSRTRQAHRSGEHDEAGDVLLNIEGVMGSRYADDLAGNQFDNLFMGGGGADLIDGGAGSDTASYAGSATGVIIDLQNLRAEGGDAAGDSLSNIENLDGSAWNDELHGDDHDNTIWGRDGDDLISGRLGQNTLYGGAGDDVLYSHEAGAGNYLDGGEGVDRVSYQWAGSGVVIDLGAAVSGSDANVGDVLVSIENLEGSEQGDDLRGSEANNTLWGLGGDDLLSAVKGENHLYGGQGSDRLVSGTGVDHFFGDDQHSSDVAPGTRDVFAFSGAHGADHVYDFELGQDLLEFEGIDASTLTVLITETGTTLSHVDGSVHVHGVHWNSLFAAKDALVGVGTILPSSLELDHFTVPESILGATIARIFADGETISDVSTLQVYEDGATSGRFEIVEVDGESVLKLKDDVELDYEAETLTAQVGGVRLEVRANAADGSFVEQSFDLSVVDMNDAPTAITLSHATVDEESPGAVVGDLAVEDQDIGDRHTFEITTPETSPFEIVSIPNQPVQLKLKDTVGLDWEALPDDKQLPLTLIATDAAGAQVEQTVYIAVSNHSEEGTPPDHPGSSNPPQIQCDVGHLMTVDGFCDDGEASTVDVFPDGNSDLPRDDVSADQEAPMGDTSPVPTAPSPTALALHEDHFEFL